MTSPLQPPVVQKVSHLLTLVIDIATVHALQLSYGPGKTAGDVGIQGRQKVDQDLMTEHWGLIEVPVVTHHKHLAGHILRGGAKLQEIKIHAAMTLQNLKPLKRILSDKNIDLQKRQ